MHTVLDECKIYIQIFFFLIRKPKEYFKRYTKSFKNNRRFFDSIEIINFTKRNESFLLLLFRNQYYIFESRIVALNHGKKNSSSSRVNLRSKVNKSSSLRKRRKSATIEKNRTNPPSSFSSPFRPRLRQFIDDNASSGPVQSSN